MSGGFEDLGLLPEILQAISDLQWHLPTDIQDEAIPLMLGGGDVMCAAETGSGKTAAFAIPIIQSVYERLKEQQEVNNKSATVNKKRKIDGGDNSTLTQIQLNTHDKDTDLLLSNNNVSCSFLPTPSNNNWCGIRATHGVKNTEVYYYEVEVKVTGNVRVGWSTISAHLELGKDGQGFGYGGKGFKSFSGKYEKYGEEYQATDVIGCYLDLKKNQVYFTKNNKHLGVCYDIPRGLQGSVWFPTITLSNSSVDVNFGQRALTYSPTAMDGSNINILVVGEARNTENLIDSESSEAYFINQQRHPLAIIIEPTKDLAEQVYQSVLDLSKYLADPILEPLLLIGGDDTYVSNKDGGNSGNRNKQLLKKLQRDGHGVDIVVGTIGKITASIENKTLNLSQTRFFILDEADKLLQSESLQAIKNIYNKCPGGGHGIHRLQVCFFSATLHEPAIKQLAETICMNPIWIDLKGMDLLPETIHHVVVPVTTSNLLPSSATTTSTSTAGTSTTEDVHFDDLLFQLVRNTITTTISNRNQVLTAAKAMVTTDAVHDDTIDFQLNNACYDKNITSQNIKLLKPWLLKQVIDTFDMPQVIVFCRSNQDCANLEQFFTNLNRHIINNTSATSLAAKASSIFGVKYNVKMLGGSMATQDRRDNLNLFKTGEVRILLCTDVAARGIDIDTLPYVINYTLPDNAADYLHRIGRVGRADKMGLAISLVSLEAQEKVWFHKNCKKASTTSNDKNSNNSKQPLNIKGVNCFNRGLVEQNGCTIWYDEGELLAQVEKKLETSVLRMQMTVNDELTLMLPDEYAVTKVVYGEVASAEIAMSRFTNNAGAAVDGVAGNNNGILGINQSAGVIATVKALSELEYQAQNLFLTMNYF